MITTPHGTIRTPAFIAVGTKATVKAVLPESLAELGAQAVLANAYHLYLQPGPDIVDAAGGLGAFMNWPGPTFTDSGGFQVLSLGAGFKKVLAMRTAGLETTTLSPQARAGSGRRRRRHVHLSPRRSLHRSRPRYRCRFSTSSGRTSFSHSTSTTLMNTRAYQEQSALRTHRWAERCLAEHRRQPHCATAARTRRSSRWCRALNTRTCVARPPAT